MTFLSICSLVIVKHKYVYCKFVINKWWPRTKGQPTNSPEHINAGRHKVPTTITHTHTVNHLEPPVEQCFVSTGGESLKLQTQFLQIFYAVCTVHFIMSYSYNQLMHKIMNRVRCICNPYIRFGNQFAILSGRSTKNHKQLWHLDTHTLDITLQALMPLTILIWIDAYSHNTKH